MRLGWKDFCEEAINNINIAIEFIDEADIIEMEIFKKESIRTKGELIAITQKITEIIKGETFYP